MSNMPNNTPKAPNILDVMSNWFFAAPVPGSSKRPNLRIKVLGNVPRVTVKTNVENDKNNGKIDFNTDLPTFAAALSTLKRIAENDIDPEGGGYNYDFIDDFVAGKRLDKPMLISSFQIGRDREDGRLYMSVLSSDKSRPRIQFFFGPSKYHSIRRRDGAELSARELSNQYAIGFCGPFSRIVEHLLMAEFNPDAKNVAKAPVPGGGNGGGYQGNRGGNGGGNYQNRNGGGYQGARSSAPDAVEFDDVF